MWSLADRCTRIDAYISRWYSPSSSRQNKRIPWEWKHHIPPRRRYVSISADGGSAPDTVHLRAVGVEEIESISWSRFHALAACVWQGAGCCIAPRLPSPGRTRSHAHGQDSVQAVDSSWNVMAHGNAQEGKWRGNWRMGWVASTLHTSSEHGVSSITTADAHNSAASSRLNWRPRPDLNGLVRFAERRNLVSVCVPSHFSHSMKWAGNLVKME